MPHGQLYVGLSEKGGKVQETVRGVFLSA